MAVWVFYDYGKYFLHSMFPAEASCLHPDLDNTTKDAIADAMLANLSGPQRFAPQEPVMDTEVPEKNRVRCL